MGWFTRRKTDAPPPKESAVGVICRLLVENPLDWTEEDVTDDGDDNPQHLLRHKSGVAVQWTTLVDVNEAACGVWYGGPGWVAAAWWEEKAIRMALRGHWAARAKGPVTDFGDTARALARAVLNGDMAAARALADLVAERSAGGTS